MRRVRELVSDRLHHIRESAIRRFIELAAQSKDVIHFEHGEPDVPTPQHIVNTAHEAMLHGETHYGPTPGLPDLRKAIAEKLERENTIPINGPEEVLVVSGTQEAMFLTALAFLGEGDEALVLDPYYPAYFEETLLAGAKPVPIPLNAKDSYRIEAQYLEKFVTPKTKMLWLSSPVNPTGHVFSKHDLEAVAAVAERNALFVFADEIYEKLLYDDMEHTSIGSLPGMKERVITANGFSKSYAMTGWRVGYVAGDRKFIDQMSKLHYYTVLCASTIAQRAALAAISGPQDCVREMVSEYARRRRVVLDALKKIKDVSYVTPHGAFYAFPNVSRFNKDDETVARTLLQQYSVATVPGSGFGEAGSGYLRLSYSVAMPQIQEGMNRLQHGLEQIAKQA
jgi:aspartate/methionine/tyrosine aminotransferase